jgi:signal transduction histidine kinase
MERVPQIADLLESKLEQMDLLVGQMLDMARLDNDRLELHMEVVDLCEVALEQMRKVRQLAPDREVSIRSESNQALAIADRSRIATIIANLLDNAIKYSPSGGEVECSVGRDDSHAYVTIRDQGLGIDPKHFDLLFKRFSRLPTAANQTIQGTGLALYLCQQYAHRLGGEILVRSKPGVGSEFSLRLPPIQVAA